MTRSGKQGLWKLPEIKSPEWGKLGPAFGYGLGCGFGVGAGLVGGLGLGVGLPGLQFGFGLGAGCGIGIGSSMANLKRHVAPSPDTSAFYSETGSKFGYGLGKGRAYDSKNSYSNVGVSASQRRGKKGHSNALSDTEIGRLVGDVMQEVAEFAARLGPK